MVETAKLEWWKVVQAVIGTLVVASILGLFGLIFSMWITLSEHGIYIDQNGISIIRLNEFKDDGERYTEEHGDADRAASIERNRVLEKQLDQTKLLINNLNKNVIDHNITAQGWINEIQHNTKASHTHTDKR